MDKTLKIKVQGAKYYYETLQLTVKPQYLNDIKKLVSERAIREYKNGWVLNESAYEEDMFDLVSTTPCGYAIHTTGALKVQFGDLSEMFIEDYNKNIHKKRVDNENLIVQTHEKACSTSFITVSSATMLGEPDDWHEFEVKVYGSEFNENMLEIQTIQCPVNDNEVMVNMVYAGRPLADIEEDIDLEQARRYGVKNDLLVIPENPVCESRQLVNIMKFKDFLNEAKKKETAEQKERRRKKKEIKDRDEFVKEMEKEELDDPNAHPERLIKFHKQFIAEDYKKIDDDIEEEEE